MKGRVYFPGLHALRFFAASLVIIHHVHQFKYWLDLPNLWGNPVVDALGHKAVSFFFVLSGFLITYLLLVEHQKNKKIDVPDFYKRRIYRIWPLYFVIVMISLFVLPMLMSEQVLAIAKQPYSFTTFVALIAFVPNLLRVTGPTIVGANQLWSVGIEEQFYIIWPLLIRRFINKIIPFLFAFIGLKLGFHLLLMLLDASTASLRVSQLFRLYELFPVEQMAVGALVAAFLYYKKDRVIRILRHDIVFYSSVGLVLFMSGSGLHFLFCSYIDAILFAIVIVNVVHRKSIYRLLEHRSFLRLGDVSYGIYMYHNLVIFLLITGLGTIFSGHSLFFDVLLYSGSVCFTILISILSFKYFEKPFLKREIRLFNSGLSYKTLQRQRIPVLSRRN